MDRRSFFRVALIGAGGVTIAPLAKKYFFLLGNPLAKNSLDELNRVTSEYLRDFKAFREVRADSILKKGQLVFWNSNVTVTSEPRGPLAGVATDDVGKYEATWIQVRGINNEILCQ